MGMDGRTGDWGRRRRTARVNHIRKDKGTGVARAVATWTAMPGTATMLTGMALTGMAFDTELEIQKN